MAASGHVSVSMDHLLQGDQVKFFDSRNSGEEVYKIWFDTKNKGDIQFYQHEGFRQVYANRNMNANKQRIIDLLHHRFLEDIDRLSGDLTVLSLGCGPGSDLLGFVSSVAMHSARCEMPVRIDAVGVDQFNWTRKFYDSAISDLHQQHLNLSDFLQTRFAFGFSMKEFVKMVIKGSHPINELPRQYNVIILSFVDVQQEDKMEFLRWTVAEQILSPGGRIYVIDNNLSKVRRLQEFGFKVVYQNEIDENLSNEIDKKNENKIVLMFEKPFASWYGSFMDSCTVL